MVALSLTHLLQGLLLIQSGLLALFLATRRTLWPLAAFLGLLSVHMAYNLGVDLWNWSFPSPIPAFVFLYGPLAWALTRLLAWKSNRPLTWPHGLPALGGLFLSVAFPRLWHGLWPLFYLSLGTYLTLSIRDMGRYRRTLRATRSESDKNNLKWLDEVLWILVGLAVFDGFKQWLAPKWGIASPLLSWLNIGGVCGLIWFLVWRGLQQSSTFSGLTPEEADLVIPAPPESSMSLPKVSAELEGLYERVADHMQRARPFLDPELSLQGLADQLKVAPRQLSMAINQVGGLNFNDFINGFRVVAARALLADPSRRGDKLLAIQFEAGFASKSVFNAVFKKVTGLTPSAYRLQNHDSGRPET